MTARLVAALERLLLIVCHIDGHTVDSYSGACMRCGAQIFTPLKESRMTRRARIEIVRTAPEVVEVDEQGREWVEGVPTYHLRLRASNGRILAHSETYANKANAKRAVAAWSDAFADLNGGRRYPWPVVEVDR